MTTSLRTDRLASGGRRRSEPAPAETPGVSTATSAAAPKRRMAYILSPSYSGSTLLTFLLAGHPGIATIGELKATHMGDIDQYRCSCGELIRVCPFWRRLTDLVRQRGGEFDVADFGTHFRFPGRPLGDRVVRTRVRNRLFESVRRTALQVVPPWRRSFRAVLEQNARLVEAVMALQGGEVFLDASKDTNRLRFLLDAGLWDLKVIYMIRDGRGAANSFMRHHGVPMAVAAREWRTTHQECDRLVAGLPLDSVTTLHYEQLCEAPDAETARIPGSSASTPRWRQATVGPPSTTSSATRCGCVPPARSGWTRSGGLPSRPRSSPPSVASPRT